MFYTYLYIYVYIYIYIFKASRFLVKSVITDFTRNLKALKKASG